MNRRLDERGETAVFAMLHTPENCLSKPLLQNCLAWRQDVYVCCVSLDSFRFSVSGVWTSSNIAPF